ncbi:MAG: D-alanine--D-alanine ligase [Syntrophorhabdaceae bacterium]|nr:D-alanine--D-alanine ligase [Syntrophorhabdaceae bacterium]MDD5243924.1 D-alanine--D-alanine ligase [Syntrophorhabdaceae bacterium]
MDKKGLKRKRIAVLYGGKSSEREISIKSGAAILNSLIKLGYNATGIDAAENLVEKLKKEKIEIAFIALHGRWGEDGTVQGLLEIMGIPYTGSGVLGSSMALDKAIMKLLFDSTGIPTPAYLISTSSHTTAFPLPFVVKPANEGSTIGISIVREKKETARAIRVARGYDRKIVIEEYIGGSEITVGIVNGKALPVIEVRPSSGFYDFHAKYTKGMTEYIIPAKIKRVTANRARATALKVYEMFELSGCARIDMLVQGDNPLVIDINTSPGMTETSLVPKAWGHLGGTFDGLVEEILKGAKLKI